ncbi:MAG: hopanoid biosynthesis associated radical SAM protein HpnJ [Deltaproteobacteria bacterium]|nr:MAG: hopanoid biosynthesis associated radical SAM protein HpnJ [Deltaproteobacteria bacterium]
MKRTLFLNPPSYDDFDGGAGSRYQATREVWSFWYPTWLCYPAGMIPGSRVLDAPPLGLTVADTVAIAREYELVVLHTSTPSFRVDAETAAAIKAARPDVTIAFVGGHPTAEPERSLREASAVDVVVRKEFDHAIVALAEGRPYAEIPALSYRDGSPTAANGASGDPASATRVVHNPEPAPLDSAALDALPFVTDIYARDLDYKRYNSPYCHYPYVSLYTGRGCPARCTFCLWPQVTTGHSYRTRSPENVYEEVRRMPQLFPEMREVFFDDDTFTADPARARAIAERLGPLGITWSTNSRANVDRETLKVLKDNGLRLFVIGYESGNEEILRNIKKGVGVERARRFTRDCHDLGIMIHGTFILGLPGETRETIAETMRFAREMNPSTIQVSLASPYPGTHFYDWVRNNGFLAVDQMVDTSGYQKCAVSYPSLSGEEIYAAVERFYRSYYFRPTYIVGSVRKMMRDPHERRRMLSEGRDFLRTMWRRRRAANGPRTVGAGQTSQPSTVATPTSAAAPTPAA